jgi:hypothetical protein
MYLQLGRWMYSSVLCLDISQAILKQLLTEDQHGTLISTIHWVTDVIGISHTENQSRIGVGNDRCALMVQQKDSTARHDDLSRATPLLIRIT